MVAEDGGEGDLAADEEIGEFEDGRLGVGGGVAVYLVAGEDHEIGFFNVEEFRDEFEGARVGVAGLRGGEGVAADAETGCEVQVGGLHDFELAVAADAEDWFCDGMGLGGADGDVGFEAFDGRVDEEGCVAHAPAWTRVRCVRAEENVESGNGMAGVTFVSPA